MLLFAKNSPKFHTYSFLGNDLQVDRALVSMEYSHHEGMETNHFPIDNNAGFQKYISLNPLNKVYKLVFLQFIHFFL
jgi:hypothetical protein